MAKIVHWYFQCIRSCQLEMAAARKPFNPVLGENFKCLWHVRSDATFRLLVKQVSHNPPVSAFHLECPGKVTVYGHLSVKAKLMGMYVGTTLSGDFVVELEPLKETYQLGYPSLYVRSILSEPWMEFGGKLLLTCVESKATCAVVFQTKPFYGGKPHHVTAEIKSSSGSVVCKISCDWNSQLELHWTSGQTVTIDLTSGHWLPKKVRPIKWQNEKESLKLWYQVAQSLAQGDFHTAAEHKKNVRLLLRKRRIFFGGLLISTSCMFIILD